MPHALNDVRAESTAINTMISMNDCSRRCNTFAGNGIPTAQNNLRDAISGTAFIITRQTFTIGWVFIDDANM